MSEKEAKSVLIVDDEDFIRDSLERLFVDDEELSKHNIFLAETANEAIDVVARNKIHLAITDIIMPGRDGIFFVKELSRISPKTEIFIMSGKSSREDVEERLDFKEFNVVDFLRKPLDLDDLLQKLKNTL